MKYHGGNIMVNFNSYEHFKKYCFKIAHNKEIKLTKKHYLAFDVFEKIPEFLSELKLSNKIDYKEDPLINIVNLFKGNKIDEATNNMDYLSRKITAFEQGNVDIYYVFTSFQSMLGINVRFTEEFISSININDRFFPSKIRALEIVKATEKINSITANGLEGNNVYGIYFIYDKDGNIAYIGKSSSNAVTRSFSSVSERGLLDFSKIEIRGTKTKSDIAIYEAYYISKYKPKCNNDLVFEDETSLSLPDLEVVKEFKRDENDYFDYSYTYYRSSSCAVKDILQKLGDTFFVDNEKNRMLLESNGIFDKYTMKSKGYEKCINEMRQKGYMAVSEMKWYLSQKG